MNRHGHKLLLVLSSFGPFGYTASFEKSDEKQAFTLEACIGGRGGGVPVSYIPGSKQDFILYPFKYIG